jgi:hypothetical protein
VGELAGGGKSSGGDEVVGFGDHSLEQRRLEMSPVGHGWQCVGVRGRVTARLGCYAVSLGWM